MTFKSAQFSSAVAVVAIAIAMAVAGRSPVEDPGSRDALQAKIAELRAEIARLRVERGAPDEKRPPEESRETPSAGSERALEPSKGREAPHSLEEIRSLLRSRSRSEQGLGLQALGSLALREDKLTLLKEILEGSDAGMKSRALSLLKALGGAESAALAVGVLQKDGPSWLRSQAASLLGDLGDAAALSSLFDASRTGDLQVRAGAVAALNQFGQPAPLQELIATLSEMLDHPDGRMREEAVDLLSTFRTPAVFSTLAKALGDRTNSRIRESAADALGQTRLTEAIPYLEGALNDPEPGVRRAAQHALDVLRTSTQ